jgi:hypothetical protein
VPKVIVEMSEQPARKDYKVLQVKTEQMEVRVLKVIVGMPE